MDSARALITQGWKISIAMINAKRVYRLMKQSALLLERKPAMPVSTRAHTGKVSVNESNQRWCSDCFEFRCDNGEKLRVNGSLILTLFRI